MFTPAQLAANPDARVAETFAKGAAALFLRETSEDILNQPNLPAVAALDILAHCAIQLVERMTQTFQVPLDDGRLCEDHAIFTDAILAALRTKPDPSEIAEARGLAAKMRAERKDRPNARD